MNFALTAFYVPLVLVTAIFGNYDSFGEAAATTNTTRESTLNLTSENITERTNQSESANITGTDTPSSTTIDWNQIPTIVGLSAIISGGVSAIVNYYVTMKQSQKQREVDVIQDMLALHSLIIYHLDKLYDVGQSAFGQGVSPQEQTSREEAKELLKNIDSSIQNKSYLLTYDAIPKWMSLKNKYKLKGVDNVTANEIWLSAEQIIKELRKELVSEYNDNIIGEFEKITRKKLTRIDDRPENRDAGLGNNG